MQIKKVTQSMWISVPVGDLLEAGINPDEIIETCVCDGRIIIQNADVNEDFVCDGDCDNCPVSEIECDDDCENCPCYNECEEGEID